MELAITQRFFELDNQDFAWKIVWTAPTKLTSMQRKIGMESMQKIPWYMELAITQPFFELQTPYFSWKFVWT